MTGRRAGTAIFTFRLDLTDPANSKINETFAACPWGTLNQTIVEAVRIGVEAMGCKPSPNAVRVAPRKRTTRKPRVTDVSGAMKTDGAPLATRSAGPSSPPGPEAPAADTRTQETEGTVARREPGPTQEQGDSGAKQSQHRKVVGDDPTRARAKVFDMVKTLTNQP